MRLGARSFGCQRFLVGWAAVATSQPALITEHFDSQPAEPPAALLQSFGGDIDQILGDHAERGDLSLGTIDIDRASQNLMQSIFYSLLDTRSQTRLLAHTLLIFGTQRKVFRSNLGRDIVADRFFMGPTYSRSLDHQLPLRLRPILPSNIQIPIGIDADAISSGFEIYSSGRMTLAADATLESQGSWFVKNSLGLLPILTQLMPALFNPAAMYDPLNLGTVAFSYPFSVEDFDHMRVATVRGASFSGGIRLPVAVQLFAGSDASRWVEQRDLNHGGGASIFAEGSLTIQVLKQSHRSAKIGLIWQQNQGFGGAIQLGQTLYLLRNSLPGIPWPGAPYYLVPSQVEASLRRVLERRYLVHVDLNRPGGGECYEKAITGDLTAISWDRFAACHLETDEQFRGTESRLQHGQNIIVLQRTDQRSTRDGVQTLYSALPTPTRVRLIRTEHERRHNSAGGSGRTAEITEVNLEVPLTSKHHLDPAQGLFTLTYRTEAANLYADQWQRLLGHLQSIQPYLDHLDPAAIQIRDPKLARQQQLMLTQTPARLRGRMLQSLPTRLGSLHATVQYRLPPDGIAALARVPADLLWQALNPSSWLSILPPRLGGYGVQALTFLPHLAETALRWAGVPLHFASESFERAATWHHHQALAQTWRQNQLGDAALTHLKATLTEMDGLRLMQFIYALRDEVPFAVSLQLHLDPDVGLAPEQRDIYDQLQHVNLPQRRKNSDRPSPEDPFQVLEPRQFVDMADTPRISSAQLRWPAPKTLELALSLHHLAPEYSASPRDIYLHVLYRRIKTSGWTEVLAEQVVAAKPFHPKGTGPVQVQMNLPAPDRAEHQSRDEAQHFQIEFEVSSDRANWSLTRTLRFTLNPDGSLSATSPQHKTSLK